MDTSSYVKLFVGEPGSDKMLVFFESEEDQNKLVSSLTRVEATSAIRRLLQRKLLRPARATAALAKLAVEIPRIIEQPIDDTVLELAQELVSRSGLRTLDAIQLASAIVARNRLNAPNMRFIASDVALKEAALAEGFEVWDPALA